MLHAVLVAGVEAEPEQGPVKEVLPRRSPSGTHKTDPSTQPGIGVHRALPGSDPGPSLVAARQ